MISRQNNKYYSKTPLSQEGTLIVRCKINSPYLRESIEIGRSTTINAKANINFMFDNARIQCVFGHLKKAGDSEEGYLMFYNDSNGVIDDIGDDINARVLDYVFEYDTYKSNIKYKTITIRKRKYLQSYIKKNNRYVFLKREKVKGSKKLVESELK